MTAIVIKYAPPGAVDAVSRHCVQVSRNAWVGMVNVRQRETILMALHRSANAMFAIYWEERGQIHYITNDQSLAGLENISFMHTR